METCILRMKQLEANKINNSLSSHTLEELKIVGLNHAELIYVMLTQFALIMDFLIPHALILLFKLTLVVAFNEYFQ